MVRNKSDKSFPAPTISYQIKFKLLISPCQINSTNYKTQPHCIYPTSFTQILTVRSTPLHPTAHISFFIFKVIDQSSQNILQKKLFWETVAHYVSKIYWITLLKPKTTYFSKQCKNHYWFLLSNEKPLLPYQRDLELILIWSLKTKVFTLVFYHFFISLRPIPLSINCRHHLWAEFEPSFHPKDIPDLNIDYQRLPMPDIKPMQPIWRLVSPDILFYHENTCSKVFINNPRMQISNF